MRLHVRLLLVSVAFVLASKMYAAPCPAFPGAEDLLWKPAVPVVWVGEMHGSEETPAAFGDLVCDALAHGKDVTVGLELSSESQAALDAVISSHDIHAAEEQLLATPNWSMGFDGRSSRAMLALIVLLRTLKTSYPSLQVVAIEHPWENTPGAKDSAVGRAVKALVQAAPNHVVLVLTGNVHAFKRSPMPFQTAAMFLPSDQVLSLLVLAQGGAIWTFNAQGCGAQTNNTFDQKKTRSLGVYADTSYAKYGIDGVLALGKPTTASPPANEAAAAKAACHHQYMTQAHNAHP